MVDPAGSRPTGNVHVLRHTCCTRLAGLLDAIVVALAARGAAGMIEMTRELIKGGT